MEKTPKKTISITRKIQLNFNTDDADQRKEHWEKLYLWQRFVFNAANKIMSELYLQDNIKDMIYLEEDIKLKLAARWKKDPNNKEEMILNDPDGMLKTSRTNSTYQYISKKVKGEVPMAIMTNLNMMLTSVYSKEQKEYYTGARSLRNYRRDIPIPIDSRSMINMRKVDQYDNYAFSLYNIPFKTFFGVDKSGNKIIWERALKGEYKLCNSSIQIKKTKIFLLAVFEFEKQELLLAKDHEAHALLSFEHPMILKIGSATIPIGNKEEYLHARLSIQGQLRKAQRSAKYGRAGHGINRRIKAVNSFRKWEHNYIQTRMHKYSNNLIKYCIQNKCGTLVLKEQTQTEEEAKETPFVLRNWSYFSLKEMILYKAAKVGIQVVVE